MPSASSVEEADGGSLLPTTDELSQALAGSDSPDSPPRPLERSASQLPSPPLLPTPPPKASCKATKTVTGGSSRPSSLLSGHTLCPCLQPILPDSRLTLTFARAQAWQAGPRESSYKALVVECRLLMPPSTVRGEPSRPRIQGMQPALRMGPSLIRSVCALGQSPGQPWPFEGQHTWAEVPLSSPPVSPSSAALASRGSNCRTSAFTHLSPMQSQAIH